MTHMTQCQKSWQAQHFVIALKSGGSFAKFIYFLSFVKILYKKNSRSRAQNASLEALLSSVVEKCCREVL